jgi:predicted ATP-dependent serine protease
MDLRFSTKWKKSANFITLQIKSNKKDDFALFNIIIHFLLFSLDDMLEGGIFSGEITEIFGHSGAGKTQFCLSLVTSVLEHSNQHKFSYIKSLKF